MESPTLLRPKKARQAKIKSYVDHVLRCEEYCPQFFPHRKTIIQRVNKFPEIFFTINDFEIDVFDS